MTDVNTNTQVPPPAAPTSGGYNASWSSQVGSGPAALLYNLADELIAIYSQVEALYGRMSEMQTSVQGTLVTAGADAQRGAAEQQAAAIASQAVGSFIGAGVAVTQAVSTYTATNPASDTLIEQQGTLNNLESMNKVAMAAREPSLNVDEATGAPVNNALQARADQLASGDFSPNTNPDIEDSDAFALLQKNGQLEDVQSNLQERISTQANKVNTTQTGIQTTQQRYATYGQIATGVATGSSQAAQASFTAKQGQQQAAQQVAQSIQQMASTTQSTTQGKDGQTYDQVASVIAAARQGAQAYAQT